MISTADFRNQYEAILDKRARHPQGCEVLPAMAQRLRQGPAGACSWGPDCRRLPIRPGKNRAWHSRPLGGWNRVVLTRIGSVLWAVPTLRCRPCARRGVGSGRRV